MIENAKDYLLLAHERLTAPEEVDAIDSFLKEGDLTATLSFAGELLVWLFSSPISQIAVPPQYLPELNRKALEAGYLEQLVEAIRKEADAAIGEILKIARTVSSSAGM